MIKTIRTGIVFPFSPRKVFRVYDVSYSEKLVHKELAQYRIRNDREFFILSYSKACEMIEKILIDNNMSIISMTIKKSSNLSISLYHYIYRYK